MDLAGSPQRSLGEITVALDAILQRCLTPVDESAGRINEGASMGATMLRMSCCVWSCGNKLFAADVKLAE